ncbi:hypothetical protein INT43_005819 [Umbelopsis isabellina]|uniref:Uncharacterized protein n=1 Tax=Mortierella isabellina TaxID=91625 RepID=A0A8H7PIX0_MORIS|nr:hypothetical protein INT43_005819 [Umbelopsis isabellina]
MTSVPTLKDALLAEQEQIGLLEFIASQTRIIREQLAQKQIMTILSAAETAKPVATQPVFKKKQPKKGPSAGHQPQNHDAPLQPSVPFEINLIRSDHSDTRSHISISSDSDSLENVQDNETQESVTFNEEEDALYMANDYLDDEIAKEVELIDQPYQSTQESAVDTQEEAELSTTPSAFVRPYPSLTRPLIVRGGKSRKSGKAKGEKVAFQPWLKRRS